MKSSKLFFFPVLAALLAAGCSGGGGMDTPPPAANLTPTVATIEDQEIDEDGVSMPIAVEVGDAETMADALNVTVTAADTTLLPASGIDLAGSGGRRSLLLAPASGVSGATTVSVEVTDADGASASTSFGVTVNALYRAEFEPWMRGVVLTRATDESAVGEANEDGTPLTDEENIPRIRFSDATAEDETAYEDILEAAQGDSGQSD